MKYINITIPTSEAERIRPQMAKMMESATPIIFRDVYGRLFTIIHGLKNRGFIGFSEETLRKYVESHSNLKLDEKLYIISCYSATNKLSSNLNIHFVEAEYPVFFNGINIDDDRYSGLSFDIITDESEKEIFAKHLAIALSVSEKEAMSIINGDE